MYKQNLIDRSPWLKLGQWMVLLFSTRINQVNTCWWDKWSLMRHFPHGSLFPFEEGLEISHHQSQPWARISCKRYAPINEYLSIWISALWKIHCLMVILTLTGMTTLPNKWWSHFSWSCTWRTFLNKLKR